MPGPLIFFYYFLHQTDSVSCSLYYLLQMSKVSYRELYFLLLIQTMSMLKI